MTAIEEDALNTVLDGEFLDIGDNYNFCIEVNNPLNSVIDKDTVVLHFFEESKPWTKGCIPEIYKLYWRYVRQSLWYDMEMKEPTTVKAAFLAGVTEERKRNYKEASKYYKATAKRLIEYYMEENKNYLFDEKLD